MNEASRLLHGFIARHETLAVLTGAGVSTGSGIPDYRDTDGQWKHAPPMQFAEFMASGAARRRYWARSYCGWERFSAAKPNRAHRILARLESEGRVDTLITQNVDRLHSRAGSARVIDLHGGLEHVRCVDCKAVQGRAAFQRQLAANNPDWAAAVSAYAPDGDAELVSADLSAFTVPDCPECNGIVKPDVVMFGESVPQRRVAEAAAAVERAHALLVLGTSLMVFSGFRFARQASQLGKPIAIVNRGRTRADGLASLKVDIDCAQALTEAVGCV